MGHDGARPARRELRGDARRDRRLRRCDGRRQVDVDEDAPEPTSDQEPQRRGLFGKRTKKKVEEVIEEVEEPDKTAIPSWLKSRFK